MEETDFPRKLETSELLKLWNPTPQTLFTFTFYYYFEELKPDMNFQLLQEYTDKNNLIHLKFRNRQIDFKFPLGLVRFILPYKEITPEIGEFLDSLDIHTSGILIYDQTLRAFLRFPQIHANNNKYIAIFQRVKSDCSLQWIEINRRLFTLAYQGTNSVFPWELFFKIDFEKI